MGCRRGIESPTPSLIVYGPAMRHTHTRASCLRTTLTIVTTVVFWAACSSESDNKPAPEPSLGEQVLASAGCNGHPATCHGAAKPTVKLVNMQDDSASFPKGTSYAVADFTGKPTMVALLQGW